MPTHTIHFSSIPNGTIVYFPASHYIYMKVGDKQGNPAVVRLYNGAYLTAEDLKKLNLGEYCKIIAKNLDEYYYNEEEKE